MTPRAPGRPRDADKAEAILDAGWALFLAHGVEATSVARIAARAGVSKVTFYRQYADRTALFEAAIRREMTRIEAAQAPPADLPPEPVSDTLRRFGTGILDYLASPPAVDFYAAIAGELRRHPDLAARFYALGPGQTRRNLAGIIAAATTRGELTVTDADAAAELLFGMWQGFANFQHALGIDTPATAARVTRGVDAFLRLYRA